MEPVIEVGGARVFHGSCLDILPTLPDQSVDAVVTDPPYGLSNVSPTGIAEAVTRWATGEREYIPEAKGFMGKAWDAFVPPPAVWDECLRVLKPGGHLLAFAGSRTFDLMALSVRLAGFEIRDSVAWLYGSGFPKSLDVSKAIDKGQGENRERQLRFTEWMRSTGITATVINEATGTNMGGHYLTDASQPAIATADLFDKLRPFLPEVPEEIERLVAERTGIEWTAYKNRPVTGVHQSAAPAQQWMENYDDKGRDLSGKERRDVASTPEAAAWQGWGTALKPAFEPVVVARKPLAGTVAENVLAYGTGALNIDGTRIGDGTGETRVVTMPDHRGGNYGQGAEAYAERATLTREVVDKGRWPNNVILDEFTAYALDEQVGGDGVSRFFYVAKASQADRNEGLDGLEVRRPDERTETGMGTFGEKGVQPQRNFHPTVKPTDLMRQLVKLVTPPGGTVLDPFTGSGSTGKAAVLEGFNFIGCELTPDYLPIIDGRLRHATDTVARIAAEEEKKKMEMLW